MKRDLVLGANRVLAGQCALSNFASEYAKLIVRKPAAAAWPWTLWSKEVHLAPSIFSLLFDGEQSSRMHATEARQSTVNRGRNIADSKPTPDLYPIPADLAAVVPGQLRMDVTNTRGPTC